jgi:hypothetical protein
LKRPLFPSAGSEKAMIAQMIVGIGNHFMTIVEGNKNLKKFGITVLVKGAQTMRFDVID